MQQPSGAKSIDTLRRISGRIRRMRDRVRRLVRPPAYPQNPDGKVFLHLGCGMVDSPEFINVDGRDLPHVHHAMGVCDLDRFADGFADLIYACHVLEHISFRETENVLKEWKRVLKPGGILRLSVPDFDKILEIYRASDRHVECIVPMLLGGHEYPANSHHAIFNAGHLETILMGIGFREVRIWDPATVANHNFSDWADKTIDFGFGSFPISLNLEAVN
jgi:predicted SAM-dependent methyltransferase